MCYIAPAMPAVNPEILVWARETAGLTPQEAVRKLGIRDTRKATALQRLAGYESGAEDPSRPLLTRMSKQYRRPLLTFYLPAPPPKGDRGADFRTLPNEVPARQAAILDTLIREMRARQSMVRDALESDDDAALLPFIASRTIADGRPAVLDALRRLLSIDLNDYRHQRNVSAAFDFLRDAAERQGIFVLLKGDLGSHHTAIELEIFRGFSIADEMAPFIVINDRDAHAAWSFTLLHEIVHLILGQTGVSGQRAENEVERFCDDVASEFLLVGDEIEKINIKNIGEINVIAERISEFADQRRISRTMVAYRTYRAGAITQSQYNELSQKFREEWRQQRAIQRAQRQTQDGGPSYYVMRHHRLGRGITSLVRQMMAEGELSTSRAARILDVHPSQVQAILTGGSRG